MGVINLINNNQMEEQKLKFDAWAIVELFGHSKIVGRITTQTIAGHEFIRVDVPKTSSTPAFTKYYGASAIYAMTPVEEEYARKYADSLNIKPVEDYTHERVISEMVTERLAVAQEAKEVFSKDKKEITHDHFSHESSDDDYEDELGF